MSSKMAENLLSTLDSCKEKTVNLLCITDEMSGMAKLIEHLLVQNRTNLIVDVVN